MKRRILLLFLCFSQAALLISQETDFAGNIGGLNMDDGLTFDNRYAGVKGSPFIFEEFQQAILFTSDKRCLEAEFMNFDRYARQIYYKPASGENAIRLNKYLIDSFHVLLPEDTLKFERLAPESQADYLYMENLYAQKSRLYLDYDKTFNAADYVDPYSADRRYDEFQDRPVFYLQLEAGGELHAIKKSKKQFSSFFGTSAKQILEYIKTEHISLKSKSDLISVASYYDQMRE